MELQERPQSRNNSKKETKLQVDPEIHEDPNIALTLKKIRFGPFRQAMRCPYCNGKMATKVDTTANAQTHMMAALMGLFCLWPCVPFVYSYRGFLKHKHFCSNCNKFLGESTFLNCFRRLKVPKY